LLLEFQRRTGERIVGALLLAGLLMKVLLEHPMGPALQTMPGWDIAVAPFAHLCGVVAGALAGGLVLVASQIKRQA